jgi:hypothetical protein
MELEAKKASKQELLRRYKLLYPKKSEPPPGRYEPNGEIIRDEDGGIERLRERLGSISRFVQELKQAWSLIKKGHGKIRALVFQTFKLLHAPPSFF